jgi:catechol 2,3-dioxygenase-like lactoylglutathione lyase family enzyme
MSRPQLTSIHHIKLAASSIPRTQHFYTSILGLSHILQFDHKTSSGDLFATMLQLPSSPSHPNSNSTLIEIRLNATQAQKDAGWNPITWAVPLRKDLEEWKQWFESNGVRCSRVFVGIKGWVLCALDPDERIVRVYCEEEHAWTTDFDTDEFWLG